MNLVENTENKQATASEAIRSKFNSFLENKYNLAFLLVLAFAFAIRFYYFLMTKSQPVWWDESEYLGMARHWALNLYFQFNPQRMPVVPLLIAVIYKFGGGIAASKFFTSVLPSTGIVAAFYFIASKMFDKRTGLLASAMAAVFWVSLFWTNRINTDMLANLFVLLGIYFTWTGLVLKENKGHVNYVVPLFVLAFITKPNMALAIISVFLFLLIYLRRELFKKEVFMSIIYSLPIIALFLIWEKIKFGNFFAFRVGTYVLTQGREVQMASRGIGWHLAKFVPIFAEQVFFWVFLAGLAIVLFHLAIGRDLIKSDKKQAANLFLVILLLISLAYFIFIERDAEDRWIYPMALSIFLITSQAIVMAHDYLKKYNKTIAVCAVLAILIAGSYFELARADSIIRIKLGAYSQEPIAGAWLKANTAPNDVISTSNEQYQFAYYTDRKVIGLPEDFAAQFKTQKPKYLVLTAYAQNAQWMLEMPQKYPRNLIPVQAYFEMLNGQKVPVIVIYELRSYDF